MTTVNELTPVRASASEECSTEKPGGFESQARQGSFSFFVCLFVCLFVLFVCLFFVLLLLLFLGGLLFFDGNVFRVNMAFALYLSVKHQASVIKH